MLTTTLVIGLLGALLMFCGDMTLYYDKNDFEQNGTLQPIIDIMKRLPKMRVMIGGWIGRSQHWYQWRDHIHTQPQPGQHIAGAG